MADKTVYGWVSGRVQGVAYRASMQREALHLHLTGWVRNLADGRVEFVATGHEAQVESLIEWARSGPAFARVDEIHSEVRDTQYFERFEVRA
ncbi:MAG: acylphosphatase [Pseudomonadota bacterium]